MAASLGFEALSARPAGPSAAVDIAVSAGLLWFDMAPFAMAPFAAGLLSGVYGLLRPRSTV